MSQDHRTRKGVSRGGPEYPGRSGICPTEPVVAAIRRTDGANVVPFLHSPEPR